MEFTETLKTRKSTRSYKPEQITEEELNKVLVAGCAAPLGMAKPFNCVSSLSAFRGSVG